MRPETQAAVIAEQRQTADPCLTCAGVEAEVQRLTATLDALLATAKANADNVRARTGPAAAHELRRWEHLIVQAKRLRKGGAQ